MAQKMAISRSLSRYDVQVGGPCGGGRPVPRRSLMADQPRYKKSIPPQVTVPEGLETRVGTSRFTDGFPDEETVAKVFDNLDFQRGVQAFLAAMLAAMRRALRSFGRDNQTVLIFESLMDSLDSRELQLARTPLLFVRPHHYLLCWPGGVAGLQGRRQPQQLGAAQRRQPSAYRQLLGPGDLSQPELHGAVYGPDKGGVLTAAVPEPK